MNIAMTYRLTADRITAKCHNLGVLRLRLGANSMAGVTLA